MSKKTLSLIFVIIFLIKISIASAINYEPNQDNKKSLDENVPNKMPKVIKNIFSNFEIAIKGQNLNEFFQNQILNLKFKNENKEYRFKEEKYEVFINQKLNETGKWKIKGLLKSFVELSPDNNEPSYFFKKIMDKNIVYYFDKNPDNPNSKKTLVEITPLDKKLEVKKDPKREIKTEPKVIEVKKEPKREIKTEPKVIEVAKEPKKEKLEQTSLISASSKKTPPGKKKIIKYICDQGKSEFYWGKTKSNMKFSRYEDSPNGKDLGPSETLWEVTEIDFEAGYVYKSGSMKYDATGDGILNTVPFAERAKIKSHDPSQGIYISKSEYSFENDPNFEEIVLEVKYSEDSLEYLLETEEYGPEYGTGKNKFWEKYTNQCIRTEYYVDKNSNGNSIKTYNDQKPIAEQAKKNIFPSQIEKQYQAQTDTLLKEINEQVLKEIGIVENQYKNVSKNINQNKDLNNESQKFVKEVSKDQLKQYKATSVITYYFFESQTNYLASLELLYRAYDKNVEADKMKAQIDYLKDSKNSENKRLKSTIQIIDDASKNIRSSIGDNSKELSEESKIFYQKSLPFAFKATEYGYKVFVVSTSVGNNIANSKDKVGSILSNFNEVIGFASIVPKIPSYVKTVGGTSKLIFTGAKAKKIKDNENLGDALEELDLSS